jgi:hypothetical protein
MNQSAPAGPDAVNGQRALVVWFAINPKYEWFNVSEVPSCRQNIP